MSDDRSNGLGNNTHRLPKPKATVAGSRTEGSKTPSFKNLSGLKAEASG